MPLFNIFGRPGLLGLETRTERLSSLHQQGALTDQEFEAAKAKILN